MNVKIEELLGREIIQISNPLIIKEIQNKVILVTGAAGSIGSDLVKQLLKYSPRKIILIDQSESGLYDLSLEIQKIVTENTVIQIIVSNITDELRMSRIFEEVKPEIVFHVAAYKHVPMMENNPYEAVKVNVGGTCIVADLSIENKVSKFIFISTDKAVNPSSVMGATKRVAEMYVQLMNDRVRITTKFIIARLVNVLESNGSVIPLFKNQIKEGSPVTVTHTEISRYFITIQEASQLILEAATLGEGGEVFLFDMGQPIKIIEIAKKMITFSGKNIEIQYTGLRSGEKLHEELLNDNEYVTSTYHPKIKRAKLVNSNHLLTGMELDELNKLLHENTDREIIAKLKNIVPEYRRNASEHKN